MTARESIADLSLQRSIRHEGRVSGPLCVFIELDCAEAGNARCGSVIVSTTTDARRLPQYINAMRFRPGWHHNQANSQTNEAVPVPMCAGAAVGSPNFVKRQQPPD